MNANTRKTKNCSAFKEMKSPSVGCVGVITRWWRRKEYFCSFTPCLSSEDDDDGGDIVSSSVL